MVVWWWRVALEFCVDGSELICLCLKRAIVCSELVILLEEYLILPVLGVDLSLKSAYELQQQTVLHLQFLHYNYTASTHHHTPTSNITHNHNDSNSPRSPSKPQRTRLSTSAPQSSIPRYRRFIPQILHAPNSNGSASPTKHRLLPRGARILACVAEPAALLLLACSRNFRETANQRGGSA